MLWLTLALGLSNLTVGLSGLTLAIIDLRRIRRLSAEVDAR